MRVASLLALLGTVVPALAQQLPLQTNSRWIVDQTGARVKLRCINWAGHMETHIPEGLNHQSIDYIANFIATQGFNCVRLTYSIDHALNPSLKVSDAFTNAAGAAGIATTATDALYASVVQNNPSLSSATTQDVYADVVAALYSKGVMTILDNHVSKAGWCCNLTDGNGWWNSAFGYNSLNSRYFDTTNWLDGLQAMASWAQQQPGVVGMSLRNELRQFLLQDLNGGNDWYDLVTQGAQRVHDTNPDVLVIIGGTESATDLSRIRARNLDFSSWAGKHVWEWHAYSFTVTFPGSGSDCSLVQQEYGALDGFLLEQGQAFTAPLFLSEFGVGQTGGDQNGLTDADLSYFNCISQYLTGNDGDWAFWAVQGSYYIRDGTTNYEETWGMMDANWVGLRNPTFRGMMDNLFEVTQGP